MIHPAGAGPVQYNYGADNAGSEQKQSRGNNVSSLTSVSADLICQNGEMLPSTALLPRHSSMEDSVGRSKVS